MRTTSPMIGATCRITHQNTDNTSDVENAFGVKESEKGGYREVFLAKDGNTGTLFLGIGGNRDVLIAQLDDVARRTFLAFLQAKGKNEC